MGGGSLAEEGRGETRLFSRLPDAESSSAHTVSPSALLEVSLSATRCVGRCESTGAASSFATLPVAVEPGTAHSPTASGEDPVVLTADGSGVLQELAEATAAAGIREGVAGEIRGSTFSRNRAGTGQEGTTVETSGAAEPDDRAGSSTPEVRSSAGYDSEDRRCSSWKSRDEDERDDTTYVGVDCFFLELPDGAVCCVAGLENLPPPAEVNERDSTEGQGEFFLARLQCHNCLQLLEFDSRAQFVQCSSCQTLNAVQTRAHSGLRGGRAMIVICGRCSTRNISCLGSLYVECWQCHTVCQVDYPADGAGVLGPGASSRSQTRLGETGVSSRARLRSRLLSRRSFHRPRISWLRTRRRGAPEAAVASGASANVAGEGTTEPGASAPRLLEAASRRSSRRLFAPFSSMRFLRRPFFSSRRHFSSTSLQRGFTHPEQSVERPAPAVAPATRTPGGSFPQPNAGRQGPTSWISEGDLGETEGRGAVPANLGGADRESHRLYRMATSTFPRRSEPLGQTHRAARSLPGRSRPNSTGGQEGPHRAALAMQISAESWERFSVEPATSAVAEELLPSAEGASVAGGSFSPGQEARDRGRSLPDVGTSPAAGLQLREATTVPPNTVATVARHQEGECGERPRRLATQGVRSESSASEGCAETGVNERGSSRFRLSSLLNAQRAAEAEERERSSASVSELESSQRESRSGCSGDTRPARPEAAEREARQNTASSRNVGATRGELLPSGGAEGLHALQPLMDDAGTSALGRDTESGRYDASNETHDVTNNPADSTSRSTIGHRSNGSNSMTSNITSNRITSNYSTSMSHSNTASTRSESNVFLSASFAPPASRREGGSSNGSGGAAFAPTDRRTFMGRGRTFHFFSFCATALLHRDTRIEGFADFRGFDTVAQSVDQNGRRRDPAESRSAPGAGRQTGDSEYSHRFPGVDSNTVAALRGVDDGQVGDGVGDGDRVSTEGPQFIHHLELDNDVLGGTERAQFNGQQQESLLGWDAERGSRARGSGGTSPRVVGADQTPARPVHGIDSVEVVGNRKKLGRILTGVRRRKTVGG
ncbi:zinc finger domain, LSD1 subclass domain-containing protein [Toxoplasma gondii ME49]|uniref:Zinc finger domain, LSD1 subclass domain-containing protein n=2 Tax=Toxoplasma gondii TaxID=5811 RepID=A0A125YFB3_TOXGV|nr:zinc finger domain, LSD1 subclass domain-containing protein [Toxoplasma gondii ME49]EPT30721.1 zinc finger domain, LSD1 subclass domain-containing protein [Toxoplasma gondii ME49]ESS31393.1 zinc finger domain, LSD1 subclass domain-containing protein [Toxoplasma gondii VEG]CEL73375.1 TPA: zinc finger domain, LSD1 subclass domain-containing protein [Toxoplasma gondii VEG]|eukprot:XP_018637628.1 zinc finger domain, LSD1 subclass domain-containing protein [Toxoplasma gondii ME49]